jgi:hypothetical protein
MSTRSGKRRPQAPAAASDERKRRPAHQATNASGGRNGRTSKLQPPKAASKSGPKAAGGRPQ